MNRRGRQDFWTDQRKQAVAKLLHDGLPRSVIATRYGLTRSALDMAIRRYELAPARPWAPRQKVSF